METVYINQLDFQDHNTIKKEKDNYINDILKKKSHGLIIEGVYRIKDECVCVCVCDEMHLTVFIG